MLLEYLNDDDDEGNVTDDSESELPVLLSVELL